MRTSALLASCLFLVSGCAVLPDATVTYYLPKSTTVFSVTQTVSCAGKNAAVSDAVTSSTDFEADAAFASITTHGLDGALSDTDVTVALTEDGRLKSVNSKQTGEAEPIIKSAVGTLVSIATTAALTPGQTKFSCKNPDQKPVSVVFASKQLSYADLATIASKTNGARIVDLSTDPASREIESQLASLGIPHPILSIVTKEDMTFIKQPKTNGSVDIALPIMRRFHLSLSLQDEVKWTSTLVLPHEDFNNEPRTYDLHIPKSAPFGVQTFALILSESGAITSIQYAKSSGASSAISGVQDVTNPLTPSSKNSRLKDEGDTMAYQQRIATCKSNPTDCK